MKNTGIDIFKAIPQLETERLILRKISKRDLNDVYDYASDTRVPEYLLWYPHPDVKFTKRYLNILESKYKEGTFYDWGVVDKVSCKMIGTCGFTAIDLNNNSAEIGYVLNSKFWGRGIAAEAARAVVTFGFEVLGLNRIEAKYMVENKASRRVLEKCYMKEEGTLRDYVYAKGRYISVVVHSILASEYQRIKELHNKKDT